MSDVADPTVDHNRSVDSIDFNTYFPIQEENVWSSQFRACMKMRCKHERLCYPNLSLVIVVVVRSTCCGRLARLVVDVE